ncbi:MAG TPA: hypothetical protein VKB76_05845 [Ktedonobacterales bacterium]|nr:hypothetical protein [Ktedonobacterales bacterium]
MRRHWPHLLRQQQLDLPDVALIQPTQHAKFSPCIVPKLVAVRGGFNLVLKDSGEPADGAALRVAFQQDALAQVSL